MKKNYKNLNLEELKKLVFENNIVDKASKDRLFKLAKANNDTETIKRMEDELDFKNAIKYIETLNKKIIENLYNSMDTESILKAIKNGLNVNLKNNKGTTFLHLAVEQDNRMLIKCLLENGADINVQDKDGATPLLLAAQENNHDSINILLEYDADVNLKSKHGYTPLIASVAKFNSIDAANLLIKNGAKINTQDFRGVTPLMLAAQQNFGSMITMLLEKGANPNIMDTNFYNALHIPCEKGHENIVKILLQTEVAVNHQDKDGDTPLMIASYHGFKNIIEMLLNKNANLNLQNKDGDTALIKAANGNHFEVVKLLVDKGAKLNITAKKDGASVLDFSFSHRNKSMTKYLISKGANKLLIKGKKLNEKLISASYNGDSELIQLFIDNGANKNYSGENGNTPLMIATTNNHLNIVEILIKNNVNINLQNNFLCTPLWSASMHQHIDIVKFLLESGADPDIVNAEGMTPLFSVVGQRIDKSDIYATTKKKLDQNDITLRIARVLLYKGANPNILNIHNSNVLNLSSRIGDTEMMKLLLDYGAKLDLQENTGLTPLMAASHTNQLDACKLLIEYGANVNQKSSTQSATALSYAIENNNIDIVKLLVKEGADIDLVSSSTLDKHMWGTLPGSMNHGTPIELARIYGLAEIESFLEKQINLGNTIENFPKGFIKLDQNLNIEVFETYLLFKSKVGDETFENKYSKDNKNQNTFIHKTKGKIILKDKYILKESNAGDQKEFKILDFKGVYLDINNTHNPKALSDSLKKFSNDERLRYTNHPWTENTYKHFYQNMLGGWTEIKNDIKSLSPNLYKKIEEFLFLKDSSKNIGFSSERIRKQLISGDKKPDSIKELSMSIDNFKQSILIKNDENQRLEDLFERVLDSCEFDIDIDLDNIEDFNKKFYTDIRKLEEALILILKDIKKVESDARVKVIIDENDEEKDLYNLRIIHLDSKYSDKSTELRDTIGKTGNFTSIYDTLKSICHWDVETECSDGIKVVHFLYPERDGVTPYIDSKPTTTEGFTHILRLYK